MEKKKKDRGGGENDLMILSWISNSRSEWKGKKKQASIEEKDDLPVQTWIYQGSLSADLNGKKNGSRRRRG